MCNDFADTVPMEDDEGMLECVVCHAEVFIGEVDISAPDEPWDCPECGSENGAD